MVGILAVQKIENHQDVTTYIGPCSWWVLPAAVREVELVPPCEGLLRGLLLPDGEDVVPVLPQPRLVPLNVWF